MNRILNFSFSTTFNPPRRRLLLLGRGTRATRNSALLQTSRSIWSGNRGRCTTSWNGNRFNVNVAPIDNFNAISARDEFQCRDRDALFHPVISNQILNDRRHEPQSLQTKRPRNHNHHNYNFNYNYSISAHLALPQTNFVHKRFYSNQSSSDLNSNSFNKSTNPSSNSRWRSPSPSLSPSSPSPSSSSSNSNSTSTSTSTSTSSSTSTSINFIFSKLPSLHLNSPSKLLDWWNNRLLVKNQQYQTQTQTQTQTGGSQNSTRNESARGQGRRTEVKDSITPSETRNSAAAISTSGSRSSESPTFPSPQSQSQSQSSQSKRPETISSPQSPPASESPSPSPSPSPAQPSPHKGGKGNGRIHELMRHPALYSPVRAPRYPIVLCHGLYGFDVRGPFLGLEIHYWAATLDILRKKAGAEVIVRGVPGTGSIQSRAESLHEYLCSPEAGVRGKRLNFAAHSMGGLDVRHLLSHIQPFPSEYIPMSLTTISTPHRGSPFMDWCNANVGVGNDLVEEAIKEEREGRNGAVLGEKSRQFLEDRRKERERLMRKRKDHHGEKEIEKVYSGVGIGDGNQKEREKKVDSKQEEQGEEEIPRPPYTLKTPLFVRPKNEKKQTDLEKSSKKQPEKTTSFSQSAMDSANQITKAGNDAVRSSSSRDGTKSETESGSESDSYSKAKELVSSNQEKEEEEASKKKKSKASSLPFGFSTLASALSSLTGNFSSYMLSLLDQPAYAMLSTRYMSKVFNPRTPDVPHVKYYSIAARTRKLAIYHPLWLPKLVLDAAAESRSIGGESDGSAEALGSEMQGNDGLVNVQSAKWGEFLGVMEGCDHWDLRGSGAPRWKNDKLDPKTGRVRQEHEERERLKSEKKERQNEEKKVKEEKKLEEKRMKSLEKERKVLEKRNQDELDRQRKKSEDENGNGNRSWIDINRLLGSWLSGSGSGSGSGGGNNVKNGGNQTESTTSSNQKSSESNTSSTSKPSSSPISTSTSSMAESFLENYASLTSSDEGSPDLSRSSASSSSSSRANSDFKPELTSLESHRSMSSSLPSASSLIPTSLTATPIPDSKLIKEVASWISDRLPERDQERRDLAEKRAEIQDRDGYGLRKGGVEGLGWRDGDGYDAFSDPSAFSLAGNHGNDWQGSDIAGVAFHSQDSNLEKKQDGIDESNHDVQVGLTLASLPHSEELNPPPGSISAPDSTILSSLSTSATSAREADVEADSKSKSDSSESWGKKPSASVPNASPFSKRELKLRRDVEWLEALGEGTQARELRRELQWHRAQHVELKSKVGSQPPSSSSSSSSFISPLPRNNPDEPLILDVPDAPIRNPNIRKPSDRDDLYDWDVPNKRRRDLLSAMGVRDSSSSSSSSSLSFTTSNLSSSTQALADGSSVNNREVSDRLGLGIERDLNPVSINRVGGGGGGGRERFDGGISSVGGRKESAKEKRERELKEEQVELERFWLALCRHLWLEGF